MLQHISTVSVSMGVQELCKYNVLFANIYQKHSIGLETLKYVPISRFNLLSKFSHLTGIMG